MRGDFDANRVYAPHTLPEQLELVADRQALQPEAALAQELYAALAALPADSATCSSPSTSPASPKGRRRAPCASGTVR